MTASQGPVVSEGRSGEPRLEELVPEELRHLLDASDAELKTGLPRVARDRDLMGVGDLNIVTGLVTKHLYLWLPIK